MRKEALVARVRVDPATGCWIYMGKDGKGVTILASAKDKVPCSNNKRYKRSASNKAAD